MDSTTLGIIGMCVLLLLLVARMPVAFALGIVGIAGVGVLGGFDRALAVLYSIPYERNSSWVLISVPLFILAGQLALFADVGKDAYEMGHKCAGRLPGGLAIGTVIGCAGFAATSGSSVATAATMGSIALPEMEKRGYDLKFAAGVVAGGGLLGILIPPSIPFIIYGFITQQSVGKLFISGILPGILTASVMCLGIAGRVLYNPKLAPRGDGAPLVEKLKAIGKAWRFFLIFGIIIGGIYTGLCTATESAAAGAFAAFILLILRKRGESWKYIGNAVRSTGVVTGMVLTIMLGAALFTIFITLARIPSNVTTWLASMEISPLAMLIVLLLLYVPLGMFLDTISMMLITLPIIYPIIIRMGIDPIWFGVLMVKMCEVALLTPPVGINVYVVKGLTPSLELTDVFKGAMFMLGMEAISVIILIMFPSISLFLPKLMG